MRVKLYSRFRSYITNFKYKYCKPNINSAYCYVKYLYTKISEAFMKNSSVDSEIYLTNTTSGVYFCGELYMYLGPRFT